MFVNYKFKKTVIFQNTFRSFINVCYSFPIHSFFSANNFLISSVIFVISNSPFHFYYVVAFYTFSRDFRCLGRDSRHHAPPRHTSPHHTHDTPHRGAPHHGTPYHGTPHHGTPPPRHTSPHHTHGTPHHGTPHHITSHHGTPHYGITHRYGDTSRCCFSIHFIVIIIFYKGNN